MHKKDKKTSTRFWNLTVTSLIDSMSNQAAGDLNLYTAELHLLHPRRDHQPADRGMAAHINSSLRRYTYNTPSPWPDRACPQPPHRPGGLYSQWSHQTRIRLSTWLFANALSDGHCPILRSDIHTAISPVAHHEHAAHAAWLILVVRVKARMPPRLRAGRVV